MIPAGVPAWATGPARESITGAITVAAELPSEIAAHLVDVSRTAFTTGVHTVVGFGAVAFIGLAILAWIVFRPSKQGARGAQEEASELELTPAAQG